MFGRYLKNYSIACYQMSLRRKETSGAPESKLTSTPLSQQRRAFMARNLQRLGVVRAQAPVGSGSPSQADVTDKNYTWYVNTSNSYCPKIHLNVMLVNDSFHFKIPDQQYDLLVHVWLERYCTSAREYAQKIAEEGVRFYEAGAGASNVLDSDMLYREYSNTYVQTFIAEERRKKKSDENVRDASFLEEIETLSHRIASTQCLRDQTSPMLVSMPNLQVLPPAFQMLWNVQTQKNFYKLMHLIQLLRLRGMYCYVKEYDTNEEGAYMVYKDAEIALETPRGRTWRRVLKIIPLQSNTSIYSKSLTRDGDHSLANLDEELRLRRELPEFCFNDSQAMDSDNILGAAPPRDDTEDLVNNPQTIDYTVRLQRYCTAVIALCNQILNTKYIKGDEIHGFLTKEMQRGIVLNFLRNHAAEQER
jgi:hypothetical protein